MEGKNEAHNRAQQNFIEEFGEMGLSIVHGIIERHGGRISVRSAPGEGTTFQIVLPRIEKVDEVGVGATM